MWNYSNYIKKVVEKSYYEMTRKYKLTNNEIAVISYLCEHEKDTATDIVNALLFSKSHVSLSVDGLGKKGLIEKVQDDRDKKVFHLVLTEKARPIVDELNLRKSNIEKVFFHNFSDKEKEQLQKSIEKVINNIKARTLLK